MAGDLHAYLLTLQAGGCYNAIHSQRPCDHGHLLDHVRYSI